jgi:hypothetical protein
VIIILSETPWGAAMGWRDRLLLLGHYAGSRLDSPCLVLRDLQAFEPAPG